MPIARLLMPVLLMFRVAWACPFCGPPPQSPSASLRSCDAAARVEIVGRSLLFAGETEAKLATRLRTVEALKGEPPAVKAEFTLAFADPSHVPQRGLAVVTLKKAGKGWEPIDIYADESGDLSTYLRKQPAPDADATLRLDFHLAHLEHADERIAEDAHGHFASVPYALLGKRRERLPAAKLRKWLVDPAVPSSRKGLYALMLAACGGADDAALLRRAQSLCVDTAAGTGGVLCARVLLGEDATKVLEPQVADASLPFAVREGAVRAAGFLWTELPADRRAGLRPVLRSALRQRFLFPYAVEELIRLREFSFTDDVQAATRDPMRTQSVMLFAKRYAEAIGEPRRTELLEFFKKN